MSLVLIILLILVLFSTLPVGPWSGWHSYGYVPSGGIGLVLLILLILVLVGRF